MVQQFNERPDVIDLARPDIPSAEIIGTKGQHLANARARGFPTPDGFLLTTTLYHRTVRSGRIERQLDEIWDTARYAQSKRLHVLARKARHLISELRIDQNVADDVIRRAEAFGPHHTVAVRSSLPRDAVSGPKCSGIHASYTNVIGPDQILSRIRSCWASLFGERALMLGSRGLGDARPSMAVIVQPMVDALKSGIVVPLGPPADVLIEATFGLGGPIVMGAIEPDSYVFDTHTNTNTIRSKTIGRKQIVLRADDPFGHSFAPSEQEFLPVLDDTEARSLATLCNDVTREFGHPHEIEWALASAGPVVLQIRPVDTIEAGRRTDADPVHDLVTGLGVGLGTASGPVRVIRCDDDVAAVELGDVVVAANTEPRWRPHLLRAAAIVTDAGDEYSHPARLAREYGIPTVVATRSATSDLIEGNLVTVDAQQGNVYSASTA
jgi:pyruvate,water dikinase